MPRTATTEEVAVALHVKPATVRKYARAQKMPFDTTPGGHRRFDVEEAVRALANASAEADDASGMWEPLEPVPFARVAPEATFTAATHVAEVTVPIVRVVDTARDIEDWAADTTVV